jgi:hypothetical protein
MEARGIMTRAAAFTILGIRCQPLGVLWYTLRDGRLSELAISLLYWVQFWLSAKTSLSAETDIREYSEIYQSFSLDNGQRLIARASSVLRTEDAIIAAEYGQPGARILVRTRNGDQLFNPYHGDDGVWHIHALLFLEDGSYFVTTGDKRKYFDLIRLSKHGCAIEQRIERLGAGYTGMVQHMSGIWVGSDFSQRANFIKKVGERRKYFLPKSCIKDFIVSIGLHDNSTIIVITRTLNHYCGHVLLFDTDKRAFVGGNPVTVTEWTAL